MKLYQEIALLQETLTEHFDSLGIAVRYHIYRGDILQPHKIYIIFKDVHDYNLYQLIGFYKNGQIYFQGNQKSWICFKYEEWPIDYENELTSV